MEPERTEHEYYCPGQKRPIARPVHLARMAAYYPDCRKCPHADDTGGLPLRLVERLRETRETAAARSTPLFFDEGASGCYLNDVGPAETRKMAAAFGIVLRDDNRRTGSEPPVSIVAGDGRPITPELVAAAAEGLRWSGCHVVDIGRASAACTAFAIGHFEADAGLLIGNPGRKTQTVGLKFWSAGGRPLSLVGDEQSSDYGPTLNGLRRVYETGLQRPCRRYGSLQRLQVEDAYLAELKDHYHALRPLRLLIDCNCGPVVEYLQRLTAPLACEVVNHRGHDSQIGRAVRKTESHLAAVIGDDGQECRVLDERGEPIDTNRLIQLVGRHVAEQFAASTVVLERETSQKTAEKLKESAAVHVTDPKRALVFQKMLESGAIFAAGPSGRFWYTTDGVPMPDALMTITLLLEILSQSDRPFSCVLDERHQES